MACEFISKHDRHNRTQRKLFVLGTSTEVSFACLLAWSTSKKAIVGPNMEWSGELWKCKWKINQNIGRGSKKNRKKRQMTKFHGNFFLANAKSNSRSRSKWRQKSDIFGYGFIDFLGSNISREKKKKSGSAKSYPRKAPFRRKKIIMFKNRKTIIKNIVEQLRVDVLRFMTWLSRRWLNSDNEHDV